MSDKGITLEGLAAAVDTLRQELATWKALARKQDTLTAAQITATQSGATAAKIDQIAVNTAAIQALSAQAAGQISLEYVTALPATGEPFTLYLVPQGDGTAPNYCNEYLWVNGDWELIGTTGSMANNGELTIQVNGVAVGTFTANQAANSAINIAVPTNTNQLVNGAQYVDAASLATALALKQNNLNAAQLDAVNSGITAALVTQIGTNTTAIAGKQDALTTAQQAAVDSGATAAKIDQIASNAAAIVSLTSSKQDTLSTAQLAAVNSGITSAAVQQISTNTTDIASKAADSAVVHLAGAETIPGNKTWTGLQTYSFGQIKSKSLSQEIGVTPANSVIQYLEFADKNNAQHGLVGLWDYNNGASEIQFSITDKYKDGAKDPTGTSDTAFLSFGFQYNGTKFITYSGQINNSIIPLTGGAFDLGSSAYIWNNVYANTFNAANGVWTQGVRAPGTSNALILAAMETWEDGARMFMYGKDSASGSVIYADIDHNDSNHTKTGVQLDINGFFPVGTSRYLGLASAGNKWLTFNGINPGALGFPNFGAAITLDTTNWDKTGKWGANANFWTPTVNGWLSVLVNGTPGNGWVQLSQADNLGQFSICLSTGYAWATIPVVANAQCKICILASTISGAKFYPCLGNV